MQHRDFIALLKDNGIGVFTTEYAARLLGKSRRYAAIFVGSSRDIENVEKGKYCIKGTDVDVVATHIVYPSYLSLISSLRFYNLTTQLPKEKYVITTRVHRTLKFRGYIIKFIKTSKKLLFGFENVNGTVVASPEKAFIDHIYLKKRIGYTEEFDSAVAAGKMDMTILKKYAIMSGNHNLINRLGHFLESRSINADDLMEYRSRNYANIGNGDEKDARWRVIYEDST